MLRTHGNALSKVKSILGSRTQILLPKQMFPCLATEETFFLVPTWSASPERGFLALRVRCSSLAKNLF